MSHADVESGGMAEGSNQPLLYSISDDRRDRRDDSNRYTPANGGNSDSKQIHKDEIERKNIKNARSSIAQLKEGMSQWIVANSQVSGLPERSDLLSSRCST